tara:strand:+ start:154435 stop:154590 length:156 start_codon:yes stop_codon:yes gene_type:complete
MMYENTQHCATALKIGKQMMVIIDANESEMIAINDHLTYSQLYNEIKALQE